MWPSKWVSAPVDRAYDPGTTVQKIPQLVGVRYHLLFRSRDNKTVITAFLRRNGIVLLCAFALVLASCSSTGEATLVQPEEQETLEPAERTGQVGSETTEQVPVGLIAPTGLTVVSTTDDAIVIEWDPFSEAEVSGYRIIRVASGGAVTEFETESNSFADSGLVEGDVFSYRVVAIGADSESSPSAVVTARVGLDTTPPRRPGRPVVVDSAEGQSISWTSSIDESGIANYVLSRELDGEIEEIVVEGETRFTDDIEPGQVVTYTVQAVDGVGNRSEPSRNTTLLTGTPSDRVVIVVSAQPTASDSTETARLQSELLEAGFTISWFEDGEFDSNIARSDDTVLLLGDVEGEGFDWNVFSSDATVIGLKSAFIQAGGFLDTPPKLDRIGSISYDPPAKESRDVTVSVLAEPKPVVFIPENEQIPDLEVWATPSFSDTTAVAGLIQSGGELANGLEAPGCRAFYPGNTDSFTESTDAGWDVLVEFVSDVEEACS